MKAPVDRAVKEYGRVEVIINNAGLMPNSPLERLKVVDWDRTMDVNIKDVDNKKTLQRAAEEFRDYIMFKRCKGKRLYLRHRRMEYRGY